MKQSIILWLGAFVITFLCGYLHSITSENYPVSGSFGIGLKKVSYFFDKVWERNENYEVIIRTDVDSLKGKVKWRKKNQNLNWNEITMTSADEALIAEIPHQQPRTIIEYKVILNYKDSTYTLPYSGNAEMKFLGAVPKSIQIFAFLSLFGGLLFSVRTALDYFNQNEKIKKYTVFTAAIWFSSALIFLPVKRTYELSAKIGGNILPIFDIFHPSWLIIFGFWILSVIIIFNVKNYKLFALIAGIITVILFQFVK